ncbi:uncharacterized protein LOC134255374 [Saccostrea cucullata]|uniref:uncharacterized protein LOC134255374 n=1 Tax=Saccostrea cuccullata TaxID=36930 RepID=UPI002ED210EB
MTDVCSAVAGSTPSLNWNAGDLPKAWQTFKTHVEFMFNGPLKKKNEEEKCSFLMIWVGDKALKVGVKDCGYQNADEMVRDRLVFGVRSDKIREKLINEGSNLTLEKAIDIARTYELSQAQLKTMHEQDPKIDIINRQKINHYASQAKTKPTQGPRKHYKHQKSFTSCTRCGKSEHERGETCPAIGRLCKKCNKRDHYECVCRSRVSYTSKHKFKNKSNKSVHTLQEESDDSDDTLFLGMLTKDVNSTNADWSTKLQLCGTMVEFQLDTGAKCNVLNRKTFKQLKLSEELKKPAFRLKSYSGHVIEPSGAAQLELTHKGCKYTTDFYIIDLDAPNVIGAQTCKSLNLVHRVNVIDEDTPVLKTLSDIFP